MKPAASFIFTFVFLIYANLSPLSCLELDQTQFKKDLKESFPSFCHFPSSDEEEQNSQNKECEICCLNIEELSQDSATPLVLEIHSFEFQIRKSPLSRSPIGSIRIRPPPFA